MSDEIRVLTCNYIDGTSIAAKGAKAYYYGGLNGDGGERRQFLVRSRGGRCVLKWERTDRLTNWRFTTVVEEQSAVYDRLRWGVHDETTALYDAFVQRVVSSSASRPFS